MDAYPLVSARCLLQERDVIKSINGKRVTLAKKTSSLIVNSTKSLVLKIERNNLRD